MNFMLKTYPESHIHACTYIYNNGNLRIDSYILSTVPAVKLSAHKIILSSNTIYKYHNYVNYQWTIALLQSNLVSL